MNTIREHDRIVLTVTVASLKAGDMGTVVHVYRDCKAFEVEFVSLEGKMLAVVTLEATQVRPVHPHEITHARSLTAA